MAFDNSIPLQQNPQDSSNPKPSKRTTGYRTSVNTPYKQQSFEAAIKLNIVLFKAIKKKFPTWFLKPYCYLDLNSGPGQDENGQDGSPLIFPRLAAEYQLDHRAYLFEREQRHADTLKFNVDERGYSHAEVHYEDHGVLLNESYPMGSNQFGVVYADPSNAAPSWDVLKAITERAPRMDILINLACASYKRQIELPHYVRLDQHLFTLKDHWLVREPIDNFQWSILFGTGYANYPESKNHGFHSIKTTRGREILERLVYTHNERRNGDQLGLL